MRSVTITSQWTIATSGSIEAAGRTFRVFSLIRSNCYSSRNRLRRHSKLQLNYPSFGRPHNYATIASAKNSMSSSPLLTAGFAKNDPLGIMVDAALLGRGGAFQGKSTLNIGICVKPTLSWTSWKLPPHRAALNTLRMIMTAPAQWSVSWQDRGDSRGCAAVDY